VSILVWVAVAGLGGASAIARFVLDAAVSSRVGRGFPFGTLAVNTSGAFILGLLVGATLEGDAYLLVGTGTLGSYTTFSTWMFESHRLGEEGQSGLLLANVFVSLIVGLGAVALGRVIGGML
jgi:fluoride exporter